MAIAGGECCAACTRAMHAKTACDLYSKMGECMDRQSVARRAQDVQSGLRDVADHRVSATIPITRQIGMAAQLAVHIRGLDTIENIVGLHGFCGSLGISSDSLPTVLGTLERIGW